MSAILHTDQERLQLLDHIIQAEGQVEILLIANGEYAFPDSAHTYPTMLALLDATLDEAIKSV